MLTIADFQANYYLPQGVPERASVRARLDRIARQHLPDAMAEKLVPSPDDEGAVYRIRNLHVDLWLDTLGMSDGEIADRWSRALVTATLQALMRAPPSEVVRYDDHAHFVAAFLDDLIAGRAWSRWVYEEFSPLRGLPVGQVVAHLLAPRPGLLVGVAQRLDRDRRLESLLTRLEPPDVRLIWERGLGFGGLTGGLPDVPIKGAVLDRILEALGVGVAMERGGAEVVARNALRLYLQAAMAHPALVEAPALGAVSCQLALLHQVWAARPGPWLWEALARGEIEGPAALVPVLDGLGSEMAVARNWLRVMLVQPSGRAYLARLVPLAVPQVRVGDEPAALAEDGGREDQRTSPQQVVTNFAGLALLLPIIRDLGLYEHLEPEGVYQMLLAAVGSRYRPLAWGDAAPGWLSGVPPRAFEWAREAAVAWPDLAAWGEPESLTRDAEAAADHLGLLPGAAFALLVLRRFAEGLRGFDASSPAYLAEQFINLPGYLTIGAETLEAHLSRAPLGIVLQMAGQDGDRGPIPWLEGRHLSIVLPAG